MAESFCYDSASFYSYLHETNFFFSAFFAKQRTGCRAFLFGIDRNMFISSNHIRFVASDPKSRQSALPNTRWALELHSRPDEQWRFQIWLLQRT